MKKLTLMALSTVVIFTNTVLAQSSETSSDGPFEKGTKVIGVSAGFGIDYGYYNSPISLPAFALQYDQGIISNVGPGTIGIGGILGVKNSSYKYASGGYKANWTNIFVGVRGTYHLTLLKDKVSKLDPYGGVTLGVRILRHNDNHPAATIVNNTYPLYGLFVGARYKFTENFGAFSELGYDVSFVRVGLALSF